MAIVQAQWITFRNNPFFIVGYHNEKSTVVERMENRCRKYESAFEMEKNDTDSEVQLYKKNVTCEFKTDYFGSEKAESGVLPHMALIGYGQRRRKRFYWKCTGSLISDRWVLSSAYCSPRDNSQWARYVLLGDMNVRSTDDLDILNNPNVKLFWIRTRVKQPEYTSSQAYYDLVLFQLNTTVEFNRFIRPICLHGWLSNDSDVFASGWGPNFFRGDPQSYNLVLRNYEFWSTNHLMKNKAEIIGNEECRRRYPASITRGDATNVIAEGINSTSQFCFKAVGNNSCQFETGSPIQQVLKDSCMYNLVGVVAIGGKCGTDLPTIYTRVQPFLEWIESVAWEWGEEFRPT
ncbi:hypothetical protein GE061_006647 [Apolygus lucorum]|uniref:Uncharacterized protein n=1 Tax=Apolygus lucorum TaxID=248454 RepID=A0A6A4J4N9_APOLU|nr:hypothetical protein GE061_006647 [Apolygus lucorum]